MKASQIWYLVLKEIEKNYYLSNTSYLSFIQVLTPICVKDNFLVIMGPNLFTINIVNRKYADFIDSCVKAVNPELSFLLISPEEAENYEAEEYERRLPEENL
ncbi:MAG: DnaA N-terminal domain-containing protein [Ezakiella sp.]